MHKNVPTVCCAIYTRKSTEEGLDQDFDSPHAQREAGEAYIKSQKHLGWTLVSTHYDDGGFTGGNLDRPALQQLPGEVAKSVTWSHGFCTRVGTRIWAKRCEV